jgi:hypothetical protein
MPFSAALPARHPSHLVCSKPFALAALMAPAVPSPAAPAARRLARARHLEGPGKLPRAGSALFLALVLCAARCLLIDLLCGLER